jgi:GntR family transcriptional regulator/MocR family aminotransferase
MNTNYEFATQRIHRAFVQQNKLDHGNKYIVLYKAIKSCIQKQELPHNWVIPSTRSLAESLQLSRTTVIKAYELLMLEKLMISRAGAGYRVFSEQQAPQFKPAALAMNPDSYPSISEKGNSFLQNISILNRQNNEVIAFKPGLPPIDIFPINQWKNLLNTYWRYIKASDLSYGQSTGSALLKTQICNYLQVSRNIKCSPEQVVVVSGSLQSIYLISSALIDKGDAVVLEDPTFPNVHSIFKSNLAKLLPIGLDEEGIRIDALDAVAHEQPKLLHVTPSDHYPLGIKMSLQRRLDLLSWASKNKALIIENDYEHELGNLKNSLPTLYNLDKEQRTIYLGTFNRLLYPSIRLGYMVLPPHLVPVIEALQEHSHRFVPPSLQMVMGQFIEKNYLFQHLKNLGEVAEERADYFKKHFAEGNQLLHINEHPVNSLHFVAHFNKAKSTAEERQLIQLLDKNDISVYPLSKCFIQQAPQTGFILGYSTVRPVVIKQKVKQFLSVLNANNSHS